MERDKRIDVLRAWGIFLVIAGHLGSPFSGFIYTFHMPLFFFITGYLKSVFLEKFYCKEDKECISTVCHFLGSKYVNL